MRAGVSWRTGALRRPREGLQLPPMLSIVPVCSNEPLPQRLAQAELTCDPRREFVESDEVTPAVSALMGPTCAFPMTAAPPMTFGGVFASSTSANSLVQL
jgi:hypothetical protein